MSISTAKAAAVLGLAAGLALAAAGSACAFPKPKYSATLPNAHAPAAQAPRSSTVAASQLPAAAANPANDAPASKPAAAPAAQPPAGAKSWSVYLVEKGDTLSGVGRRFGAPVKTLADLNELDAKTPLKAGLKLKLPPGTVDSGKDPYAAGPSPFALGGASSARAASSHAAASGAKAKPARLAEAEAQPASPPAQRPATAATKPASSKPAATSATEAPPARLAVALRPPVPEPVQPHVAAAPKPAPAEPLPLADAAADADPAVSAGHGRFAWPVKGTVLSRFGPLGPGERNDGVNIGADQGADVRAAAAGEVVYAGSDVKGFGNVVLIKHPDGWVTAYAHLGGVGVRIRDRVEQGQTIGTVGKSGGVDQPQLHFETRWSGAPREKHKPVDPLKLLP